MFGYSTALEKVHYLQLDNDVNPFMTKIRFS